MNKDTPQSNTDWRELEALSEKIHHLYCEQYLKDNGKPYWTNGDYSLLDERTKEYDRNIARFISQLLEAEKKRWGEEIYDMRRDQGGFPNTVYSKEDSIFNSALDAVLQKLS